MPDKQSKNCSIFCRRKNGVLVWGHPYIRDYTVYSVDCCVIQCVYPIWQGYFSFIFDVTVKTLYRDLCGESEIGHQSYARFHFLYINLYITKTLYNSTRRFLIGQKRASVSFRDVMDFELSNHRAPFCRYTEIYVN